MTALRVTIGTYDDDPPQGGQGVYVRGLRAALLRRGVDVATVAGRGANAIAVPRRTGRPPLDLSWRLNRRPELLLEAHPAVVHLQGGPGGVLLVRSLPVPVIYTAHHTYAQAHGRLRLQRMLGGLEGHAYRRAAVVLAVSPSTADAVIELGVHQDDVHVVPPGIDCDRLAAAARRNRRAEFGVLFVGRLEPEKGPLEAVAIMSALAAEDPRVRGVVVGRGRLERAVREAAAAAPQGSIRVSTDSDDGGVADEFARAAVVIIPSAYEGLGLVALEALAAGAVPVGHDVPGLRDAIGRNGALVAHGDRTAFFAAVRSLLHDAGRREELAASGAERVRREHAWDGVAARVVESYRLALARHI